jgi:uncharacterized membrane protein YbhN (UPF0104 family)
VTPASPLSRRSALPRARPAARLPAIVATLVGVALFAYVLDIASHADLLGGLGSVVVSLGWLALLLAIPYVALRALTWRLLLEQVGVRAPLRQTVAAFCAGELTKSLPFGVYLESYAIARLEGLGERGLVAAAVATTGLDIAVGTVTFLAAMIIGLPGADWLRPLVVAIVGGWIVLYLAIWLLVGRRRPDRALGRIITEAADAARQLARPALLRPVATTAAYLAISITVLWLILEALGLGGFGIGAAVTAVVIASLVNVILPIPIELGVTEISGVGILSTFGVEPHQAAVVMVGYRLATTGALTIVLLAVLAYLRGAYLAPEAVRLAPEA